MAYPRGIFQQSTSRKKTGHKSSGSLRCDPGSWSRRHGTVQMHPRRPPNHHRPRSRGPKKRQHSPRAQLGGLCRPCLLSGKLQAAKASHRPGASWSPGQQRGTRPGSHHLGRSSTGAGISVVCVSPPAPRPVTPGQAERGTGHRGSAGPRG